MLQRRIYDAATSLKGPSLVSASGNGVIVLDLGDGLSRGHFVIEATAVETASGDEMFTVQLVGSNVADFASGKATLAEKRLGNVPNSDAVMGAGRYVIPYRNELNGKTYRYVRQQTIVVGTIATGINFSAYLERD